MRIVIWCALVTLAAGCAAPSATTGQAKPTAAAARSAKQPKILCEDEQLIGSRVATAHECNAPASSTSPR